MEEADSSVERDTTGRVDVDVDMIFPEGGLQAWLTVLGAALAQYATFGYTNAFGVYQGYLDSYSPGVIGWIGGVQIFLILSSGIVTGRLFDRGYFHHLMISGSILHTFSFFMLSLSHPNKYYQVFLSQGIGGGLSVGLMYTPSLAIVSHYFKRNHPIAIGIVTAGTALGAVLHPIMLNHFFRGSLGFHNGVRAAAGLNSGLLILSNTIMRTRLPPRTTTKTIPLKDFACDAPYVFAVLGGMLIITGFSFPVFFLQLYGSVQGLGNFSTYILSILNSCSVMGRILVPALARKLGVINLAIFVTFSMAILEYFLLVIYNVQGFVAFAVVYGCVSGAGVALTPAMLASLGRDVDEVGARIGVAFAFAGVVGLFSNTVSGALLTQEFHWSRPIICAGSLVVSGGFCYLLARHLVVKQKKTQVV